MKRAFWYFAVMAALTSSVVAQRSVGLQVETVADGAFNNQITFGGGSTSVRFSSDFTGAAAALGLSVSPIRTAGIRGANASFPITWGTVDGGTLRGEIMHSRFLMFERGPAAVKIEGFIIDTTGSQAVINGLASANGSVVGRIPLFNVDLSSASITQTGGVVQISGVVLTLRGEAAAALNAVFSTNAFVEGFNIGTATVSGVVLPNP